MSEAACVDQPVGIFYPERGVSARQARAVCATCPVTASCLRYALEASDRHGVWGGMSERERAAIRRRQHQLPRA